MSEVEVSVVEPSDVTACPLCKTPPGPGLRLSRCPCGGVTYQRDRGGVVQWFLSLGYAREVSRRMVQEAVEEAVEELGRRTAPRDVEIEGGSARTDTTTEETEQPDPLARCESNMQDTDKP